MAGYIRRYDFDPGLPVLLQIESVNILDLDPPAAITGVNSGTTLIVGEFEDGPFAETTEVSSANDLLAVFGGFGYTYDSVGANNCCAVRRSADGGSAEFWNGNGAVHLNGKKFGRLLVCRVDTSVGEVQFSRLASLNGAASFVYNLEPAQNFVFEDGSGPTTVTFNAAEATIISAAGTYPTGFAGGETLTLGYDDESDFTVVFLAGDQTIDDVVARINQYAGYTMASGAVNILTMIGRIRGTLGEMRVVTGSAGVLAALGLTASTVNGTGNVRNIDQVSVTEIDAAVDAASGGDFSVVQNPDSTIKLQNNAGGSTGSFRVVSSTATALGLPVGVSSSANTSVAKYISAAGVYPTTFAGGETLTLGYDDEPNFVVTFLVADQTIGDVVARINAAAGYTMAVAETATRISLSGRADGGQVRVVAVSALLVLTALGFQLTTVDGQVNDSGVLPAGTRVRVPSGQRFVTMQSVDVAADSAGPYTARVRHAADNGTGLSAAPATITEMEAAITLAAFGVTNVTPVSAALSESAIDTKYGEAIDSTIDLNSVARETNIIFSARQSNAIRRKLRENVIEAGAVGCLGRVAPIRPPLGTAKARAKSSTAEPGVGATRSDNVQYCYPGVRTQIPAMALRGLSGGEGFTADGIVDVGSDGFLASIMSQLPPEENPGQETAFALGAISLESSPNAKGFNINDYIAFKAAGIAAPRFDNGVMIFQSGVTSVDPLVKPNRVTIARRRMSYFIQDTIAIRAKAFSKKLNTFARRRAFVGEVQQFLDDLVSANNPSAQRIDGYSIDFTTANTPATLARGMFRVIINVRTLSSLDSIVIETNIGESVVVSETALSLKPV